MPVLGQDPGSEIVKIPSTSFAYSTTRIADLASSSEYTQVEIVSDVSPSVEPYKAEMEATLKDAVASCLTSVRADSLLLRHTIFAGAGARENHGWKLLSTINLADYDDCLKISGGTALYDATLEGVQVMRDSTAKLVAAKYTVNGIQFIITDGEDNSSYNQPSAIKAELDKIRVEEKMESFITILIGVGVERQSSRDALARFKTEAGLTHYVEIKDASKASLAKLAAFISKSISATSQSLGTGGPSKQLTSQNLTI